MDKDIKDIEINVGKYVHGNSTENKGLLLPVEVAERLLNDIRNRTLKDDHETFYAISHRVKAIILGDYIWDGDPYFDQLYDELMNFYRHDINKKYVDPECLFCMGELLGSFQMLKRFLENKR